MKMNYEKLPVTKLFVFKVERKGESYREIDLNMCSSCFFSPVGPLGGGYGGGGPNMIF